MKKALAALCLLLPIAASADECLRSSGIDAKGRSHRAAEIMASVYCDGNMGREVLLTVVGDTVIVSVWASKEQLRFMTTSRKGKTIWETLLLDQMKLLPPAIGVKRAMFVFFLVRPGGQRDTAPRLTVVQVNEDSKPVFKWGSVP